MIRMRLWTASAVILAVILAGFVLSVPHTKDATVAPTPAPVPVAVLVQDTYAKGTHTITTTLEAPDACATATAEATLVEGGIQVSIAMPPDVGICLELPHRMALTSTIAAEPNLPISVVVNGEAAAITFK